MTPIEKLKVKLEKAIFKNNFNLISTEVVELSQKLDIEIVKEQMGKLLYKAA